MTNKKYHVKYLTSFSEELNDILYYITNALKNPIAAENLLNKIIKSIEIRSQNPESHEIYKTKNSSKYIWYRIYLNNYTIFYIVENNEMKIAHMMYSLRNIDNLI